LYSWGEEASYGQMGYKTDEYCVREPRLVPVEAGIQRVYCGIFTSFVVYD